MPDTHIFGVSESDPFGVATTGLILNSVNKTTSLQTAIADDEVGEYVTASQKSFGGQENITATYGSTQTTSFTGLSISAGGATAEAITSISVSLTKGQHASVNVTGHKHSLSGGSYGTHNASGSRTVSIPAFPGFGCSSFGLSVGIQADSLQSATYTVELGHTDDQGESGDFLCGTTHGEKHTVSLEAIDEADWIVPEGWILQEKGKPQTNQTHHHRTLTIVKFVGAPSD